MAQTIIFYAPIGKGIKGSKNGGAEAGCRKTMHVLLNAGFKVIHVEKPSKNGNGVIDSVLFVFKLLIVLLKLTWYFITTPGACFHIAGFYLNQIYYELSVAWIGRVLNHKIVYEIRNGGMIEAFNSGSNLYKFCFEKIMKVSTIILAQGEEYLPFIKDKFRKHAVYYPNYIIDSFISENKNGREKESEVSFIYFGRVVPDKNIEFIVDVFIYLNKINLKARLNIIGGYELDYYSNLMQKIKSEQLVDKINFTGRLEFDKIYVYLKRSHFFIFPSKEKREGHSNSLTEAMGCGVVPIVSKAGFNESIVNDPYLVVNEFDIREYGDRILDIWNEGKWEFYSSYVFDRIVNNYTETKVGEVLINCYKSL